MNLGQNKPFLVFKIIKISKSLILGGQNRNVKKPAKNDKLDKPLPIYSTVHRCLWVGPYSRFKATIFMIITKVTEKFMISSSRIVNITLDSKEDEKQCREV